MAASASHSIAPDHGLACVKLHGEVDGPFVVSCIQALRSDPQWSDTFDVIWDERNVAVLDVTPEGLDQMVDAQTSGQTGRDLIVSPRRSRDLILQLYAMRTRRRGRPAEVFRTLDDALDAIGLSELPAAIRDE